MKKICFRCMIKEVNERILIYMYDGTTEKLIIVRGGGDLATGTIHCLVRCGFPVLVLETAHPSAIRRQVAFSEAVYDGSAVVEGIICRRAKDLNQAFEIMHSGQAALLVDETCQILKELRPWALVDAILAKRNLGTHRDMANRTIALGPGFTAGKDVDYVIETKRGHNLGRIIEHGSAAPNTGIPGIIGGFGKERVLHAPAAGRIHPLVPIGSHVERDQILAWIDPFGPEGNEKISAAEKDAAGEKNSGTDRIPVHASLTGLLRGMIRDGYPVSKGFKIADIDPRDSEWENCFTISDKARCIAGSVLEALML